MADALGHFAEHRDKIVEPLTGMLTDENAQVRAMTVIALGKLGKDMPKVQEAINGLSSDPDPQVVLAVKVASALLKPGDASQIPALLEGVASKDEITSQVASRALRGVSRKAIDQTIAGLVAILDKGEEPSTKNAMIALEFLTTDALPVLPKVLALYDSGNDTRRLEVLRAAYTIDPTGDMAVPPLVKGLSDQNPAIRKRALMGLMRYPDKVETFLVPLTRELADPNEDNRLIALSIVRRAGPRAVEAQPGVITLSKEGSYKVRLAAISALGAFKPTSPQIMKALSDGLLDNEPRIREASVSALRRIGVFNSNEVKALLEIAETTEKDPHVKRTIQQSLEGLTKANAAGKGAAKR